MPTVPLAVTKLSPAMSRRLTTLFTRRAELAEQAKAIDEAKRAVDAELLQLTDDAGGAIVTPEWRTQIVTTTRKTLSEELLLKHGVKPTVIEKCRVETTNKPYVKVTAIGEGGGQ